MPRGLTLIEVLAALVVLSVLLGGVLLAKGGAERQWAAADRKLAAVAAADRLLASWWGSTGLTVPTQTSGPVPGRDDMVWQTAIIPDAAAEAWNTQVVRLTIAGEQGGQVWTTVDVLVPLEPVAEAGEAILEGPAAPPQEGGEHGE